MTKLYKCTLQCKIKKIPDMVEYLKAKNDDTLITMFEQCENIVGSSYYGYKWIAIELMRIKDFPEVMTVEVKVQCTT